MDRWWQGKFIFVLNFLSSKNRRIQLKTCDRDVNDANWKWAPKDTVQFVPNSRLLKVLVMSSSQSRHPQTNEQLSINKLINYIYEPWEGIGFLLLRALQQWRTRRPVSAPNVQAPSQRRVERSWKGRWNPNFLIFYACATHVSNWTLLLPMPVTRDLLFIYFFRHYLFIHPIVILIHRYVPFNYWMC